MTTPGIGIVASVANLCGITYVAMFSDPDATFAERLYRIRNILFHDYGVLHSQGEAISSICQGLYSYLVERKILA